MSTHVRRTVAKVIGGVVVAVGLVAATLVPHMREKPRSTSCLGNMRLILNASRGYAQDHDGLLPPVPDYAALLGDYHAARLRCYLATDRIGYALVPGRAGARLDDLADAPGAILEFEADGGVPAYRHQRNREWIWIKWEEPEPVFGLPRKYLSIGYADGHARFRSRRALPPEQILQGYDPRYTRR